jgi:tyrosyl-tRNA synthetase
VIEFLREIGKHFTVNYMLGKEVVSSRLAGEGISFTEFSYMLLQAFDFLHLYDNYGCKIQVGGSDQWGNITAGLELIRKKISGQAFGLSFPLLTDGAGRKLGKSEGGAIWLDPELTSPYQLYQFLFNSGDQDSLTFIKAITLIEAAEFNLLAERAKLKPEERLVQRELARRVVELTHGSAALEQVERSLQALFGGELTGLTKTEIKELYSQAPCVTLSMEQLRELSLAELFILAKLCSSKSEARRLFSQGGGYLNNQRIQNPDQLAQDFVKDQELLLLRSGKKSYALIDIVLE